MGAICDAAVVGSSGNTWTLRVQYQPSAQARAEARLVQHTPRSEEEREKLEASLAQPIPIVQVDYDAANGTIRVV